MSRIAQFLLYNLCPALMSGLLAWLVISASLAVLRIKYSPLRLSLLYAPVVKATLVMLGVGLALPWPRDFFQGWQARALPDAILLPLFLIWSGMALFLRALLARRARQLAMRESVPANEAAPRLVQALDRVTDVYRAHDPCRAGSAWANCCLDQPLPRPNLVVSKAAGSPYVINDKAGPVLVFPVGLAPYLTDAELCAALAHEMAHLTMKQAAWCSSAVVRWLVGVAPLAGLLAAQLQHEEEKACDDMAIAVLGDRDVFASMLLKSYRYASQEARPLWQGLQGIRPLLGLKPRFSERVERLTRSEDLQDHLWRQRCAVCILWVGVILFF